MRRFRLSISLAFSMVPLLILASDNLEHSTVNIWHDSTFHQVNVDCSRLERGIIRAKVDGNWQDYTVREFPQSFGEWSFERRIETLQRFRKQQPPELAGPHNAMVATCGIARNDSRFRINNAVKGMGWLPRPEKLSEMVTLLESTMDDGFSAKLDRLDSIYNLGDSIFDPTCQVSLELYATPEFETGTFLNQITNPACAIVFLDIPSYEFKAIAHLMHPSDPELSEQEKLQVKYANLIHSYFHGAFDKQFTAVVYYAVEVYDNSPGKLEARGKRLVPALPLMP